MDSGLAWPTSASVAVSKPSACPASPRVFSLPLLPNTPPSQLLKAATTPPPLRRARSLPPAPKASHPVLVSAITSVVKCARVADALKPTTRFPAQRQLGQQFALSAPQTPQHSASPFAFPAKTSELPSLLDKINSLPGSKDALRSVLAQRHNDMSFQDSGVLLHMLHRASPPGPESECPAAATSTGSATRSDINDTGGRFTPHQAKGTQLGPITVPPMQMSDKTTPPSITPERSSYLNSSRSAFDKRSLNHMVCQPIDVITCSAPQPSSTQQTGTVAPELAPFMPYSGSIQFRTGADGQEQEQLVGQTASPLPPGDATQGMFPLAWSGSEGCATQFQRQESAWGTADRSQDHGSRRAVADGPMGHPFDSGPCSEFPSRVDQPAQSRPITQDSCSRPAQISCDRDECCAHPELNCLSSCEFNNPSDSHSNKQVAWREHFHNPHDIQSLLKGVQHPFNGFQRPPKGSQHLFGGFQNSPNKAGLPLVGSGPSTPQGLDPCIRAAASCPSSYVHVLDQTMPTALRAAPPIPRAVPCSSKAAQNSLERQLDRSRGLKRPRLEDSLRERSMVGVEHCKRAAAMTSRKDV